jgi:hypothetical protein
VQALIDPSCEPSPAVSRATSEPAEVCCGQRRVRRTRDAGGSQTNKSRSRPLSLASEPHEDGVRFPPATRCCRRGVPRSRRLCARACVSECMSVCIRAACAHVSARFCVDAPVCACVSVSVSSGVCECVHACHPMPHEPANPHAKRTTAAALLRWPSAPTAASPHGICRGAHRSMGHRMLPCTPAVAPSHHGSYPMSWPHTFSRHASYAPLAPIARCSSAT